MAAATDPSLTQGQPGQLPTGTLLGGRFQIQAPIGKPGLCQYYRASDTEKGGLVTAQVIPGAAIGAAVDTLEAQLAQVQAFPHKNLVDIFAFGRDGHLFFVATEMLDGSSLRQLIDGKRAEGRGITFKAASSIMAHLANLLGSVHQFMPHGGLNPDNVWLNRAGRVKVCELGMVHAVPALARRGNPTGTPDTLYIAPELLAGSPPSPVSDVYSLGAILYELLTMRPAVAPMATVTQVKPDLPAELDAIIDKALQRNPAARWQSPIEMGEAVMAAQAAGSSSRATQAPRPAQSQAQAAALPQPAAAAQAAAPVPVAGGLPAGQPAPVPAAAMPQAAPGLPGAPAAPQAPQLQLGRSFNVADAANALADDTQERWLIQKDKLDFGPFSMVQIKAQIERGEIKAQHMIVDMDSGARKQIKDFAPLREFTKAAERKLEQLRRMQAEQRHEKAEKSRSKVFRLVIGSAVLVVAIGIGLFIYSRKAAEDEKLASRVGEADIDAFLQGVKIDLAQVKVNRTHGPRRGGGSGSGGPNDEFNNDMTLGDVSWGGSGAGDETLDDGVVQDVMVRNYRSLVPCLMEERKHSPGLSKVELEFVVRGDGHVSAVKVNGQRSGSFPACVLGRMKSFNFPKFNGKKTIAAWSMSMR